LASGNATRAVHMAVGPDGRVALVAPGNAHNRGVPQLMVVDPNQVNGQCEPGGGPFPGRRPVSDAGVPLDWERRDADVPTEGPLDDLGVPPGPIAAQPNGEAIAVDFARNGHIVVQTRDPATLQIMTHSGKGLVLSYERTKHTGHAVFHANSSAGLACASCHPEGGDDGLVWTFEKIGPRRTQSLRGGILQTAPFHWDGDMKTMDVLMKDVFEQRMSGPKLEARHHEALAAWMDRIPAMPAKRSPTEESVARGKMLFESPAVGCARCHGGPMLTDNTTVNVGTGKPMQVPPLRGVAWRAPFMHTGCAQTLADRFKKDCGGDDRHGVTSRLSAAQLADLVAYMESL
jgi:mono/diheme cytochrome c family protein